MLYALLLAMALDEPRCELPSYALERRSLAEDARGAYAVVSRERERAARGYERCAGGRTPSEHQRMMIGIDLVLAGEEAWRTGDARRGCRLSAEGYPSLRDVVVGRALPPPDRRTAARVFEQAQVDRLDDGARFYPVGRAVAACARAPATLGALRR